MGQDVTARKEALSKMYEDSKSGFPDVCEFTWHNQLRSGPLYPIHNGSDGNVWQVQAISCKELRELMSSSESIVLVDVRSPDEQSVSSLPGHVVKKVDFEQQDPQDYSNSTIVTYWYAGDQLQTCHA